jgi:hypothetical protein
VAPLSQMIGSNSRSIQLILTRLIMALYLFTAHPTFCPATSRSPRMPPPSCQRSVGQAAGRRARCWGPAPGCCCPRSGSPGRQTARPARLQMNSPSLRLQPQSRPRQTRIALPAARSARFRCRPGASEQLPPRLSRAACRPPGAKVRPAAAAAAASCQKRSQRTPSSSRCLSTQGKRG